MAQARGKLLLNFLVSGLGQWRFGLVVETQNLLRNGMSPTGKKPALGRGYPPFGAEDSAGIHAFLAEILEEGIAHRIIPDNGNRQHLCAKGCKIVGGVGPSSRNHLRLAMLQDQNRGFARDAGDVAVTKFVGHEITQENNRLSGEFLHTLGKVAKVHRCGGCLCGWGPLHCACLKIQSTAWVKSSAMKSGGVGHFAACQASSPWP